MKTIRKFIVVAAACTASLGILGMTAPAHADVSWGTTKVGTRILK
ncbi:hypothetical protein [Nocardioides sp.]